MERVFHVTHKGRAKMVGKLFPFGGGHVFLHDETIATQHVRVLDSPGGLDVCVIARLRELAPFLGPIVIHHFRDGMTFAASLDLLEREGVRKQWDGRDRLFLSYDFWLPVHVDYGRGPFIRHAIETLDPGGGPLSSWKPIEPPRAPEPPNAGPQLPLQL